MKIRVGNWFKGSCYHCAANNVMVRKFKGGKICMTCAEEKIKNALGKTEGLYGEPETPSEAVS